MKKKFDLRIFTLVCLIFSLIIIMFGVTFAIYSNLLKGNTSNIINTGKLYFAYNEGDFLENGVQIHDAYPISDSTGKALTGANKYFDFSVNGETTVGDINYEVVAVKQPGSTLNDDTVKVYLTKLNGSNETPSDIVMKGDVVRKFSELDDSQNQEGKILYIDKVPNYSTNYVQNFRLRMWISDDVDNDADIFRKSFSVKVNVLGVQ